MLDSSVTKLENILVMAEKDHSEVKIYYNINIKF